MKMFYLLIGEETAGPYSVGELQAMLQRGTIEWNTLYATDGAGEWKPVGALKEVIDQGMAVDEPLYGSRDVTPWVMGAMVAVMAGVLVFGIAQHADAGTAIGILAGLGIGVPLYFLPTIVARGNKNFAAICALNVLLGWTFVGWVAALVWALKRD